MFKEYTNLLRKGYTLNWYGVKLSYSNGRFYTNYVEDEEEPLWMSAKQLIKNFAKETKWFYSIPSIEEITTPQELASSRIYS